MDQRITYQKVIIIWCPSRHSLFGSIFLLLQYSVLQDSSSLNFLRWGLKFSEGGVPGGEMEPGTAVQQSSAQSTKPRCTLLSHAASY